MIHRAFIKPSFVARKLVPAVGLALAVTSGHSYAQAALEEVVVTASKRAQTLQDIPIAVSVVSSEQIEQAGVLDIKDLQNDAKRVPRKPATPPNTNQKPVSNLAFPQIVLEKREFRHRSLEAI